MKLRNIFMAVIAAGAVIMGCDPENLGEDAFEVSNTEDIVIAKEGGSYEFTVRSTFDWVIRGVEEAADWLDVTVDGESLTSDKATIKAQAKERFIEVSALANDGSNREVTLTLFAGVRNKITVKVLQEGAKGDGIINTTVADLIANPSKEVTYRLSGTVSGFSATYCSFNLDDGTGSIYVYSMAEASKAEYKDKIKNGGTITIKGNYEFYEAKSQHEIINAVVEEYVAPETGDPDKATASTVADFIQKADKVNYYILTGIISGFNSNYCSFDLTDETGTIYVYNVTEESKAQYKDKLKNGYKVVVRGQYDYYAAKQQHEVINAIIDSYEEVAPETDEITGLVVAVSKAGFLVKNADGITYAYDSTKEPTVKVGDIVTVTGEKSTYNGTPELVNYTVTVNSSNNPVDYPEPTVLADNEAFDAYSTMFGYVKFYGKLTKSGNYYNLKVPKAARTGSLSQPVAVDETLLDKWVDVTGYFVGISGGSYFNVIYTAMTLAADQDPDLGGGGEESGDATVGENEVGYELTNAEIVAALSTSENTKDTYADFEISSAVGKWTGNMNTKKTLQYLQLRNKSGAHLKSPVFAKNIKRVVLRINEATVVRTLYAIPTSVAVPTSGDNYGSTLWSSAYGSVKTENKVAGSKVITITGETKDFTLVVGDGAAYIDSILVICEQ